VATTLFTSDIPTLALALSAKPAAQVDDLLPRLVHFPTAIVTTIIGVALCTCDKNHFLDALNTVYVPDRVIAIFHRVTGVDYKQGDVIVAAAATIVAQKHAPSSSPTRRSC